MSAIHCIHCGTELIEPADLLRELFAGGAGEPAPGVGVIRAQSAQVGSGRLHPFLVCRSIFLSPNSEMITLDDLSTMSIFIFILCYL